MDAPYFLQAKKKNHTHAFLVAFFIKRRPSTSRGQDDCMVTWDARRPPPPQEPCSKLLQSDELAYQLHSQSRRGSYGTYAHPQRALWRPRPTTNDPPAPDVPDKNNQRGKAVKKPDTLLVATRSQKGLRVYNIIKSKLDDTDGPRKVYTYTISYPMSKKIDCISYEGCVQCPIVFV